MVPHALRKNIGHRDAERFLRAALTL